MHLNKAAKILMATGATLITGALFFPKKSKAASLPQHTIPAQKNTSSSEGAASSGAKIISNHDGTYDYKHENGKWYTRRKGISSWIDMQAAHTPQAYQLAVSRLQKYV